jgi:hypothetical protein
MNVGVREPGFNRLRRPLRICQPSVFLFIPMSKTIRFRRRDFERGFFNERKWGWNRSLCWDGRIAKCPRYAAQWRLSL